MIYSKQSDRVMHSRVSAYKGVHWHNVSQKWASQITVNGVRYDCGYFDDDRAAALSRDRKIIALNLKKPLQILKRVQK